MTKRLVAAVTIEIASDDLLEIVDDVAKIRPAWTAFLSELETQDIKAVSSFHVVKDGDGQSSGEKSTKPYTGKPRGRKPRVVQEVPQPAYAGEAAD